jgi:hypothetical protein
LVLADIQNYLDREVLTFLGTPDQRSGGPLKGGKDIILASRQIDNDRAKRRATMEVNVLVARSLKIISMPVALVG